MDVIEGFWQGLLPACPEGATIGCAPVAIAQAVGGSSVCCAENQAKENCVGTCQAFSRFLSRL